MIRRGKKSNDPILFDVWRKCGGMGILCQMCVGMIFLWNQLANVQPTERGVKKTPPNAIDKCVIHV